MYCSKDFGLSKDWRFLLEIDSEELLSTCEAQGTLLSSLVLFVVWRCCYSTFYLCAHLSVPNSVTHAWPRWQAWLSCDSNDCILDPSQLLLAYAHNPCSQPFVLTCYCIIYIYRQFGYIYYPPPYKYTTQLGVILRREYPGVIVEVDGNTQCSSEEVASCWLLYSYCSEFAWLLQWGSGLMLVCNVSHLKNQQFEHSKPCPIPLTVVTLSSLEALLKVLYCWETIPLTVVTLFTFRQLSLLMLPQNLPTMVMMLTTPMGIFMLQTLSTIKVPTTMAIMHR
jgi:hypothetical protein